MEKSHGKSGLALAGLILGAIAVALSAIPIINNFAALLAVLALIFGIVGIVQTRGSRKGGRGKAITAVILSVVAIAVVLISQSLYSAALNQASNDVNNSVDKASGKKTDELLANEVDVKLGEFAVTEANYLTETKLPITVTNKNAETKSYSIQVEAVDANGTRIADDTIYANNLGTGQAQEFKAFQYVESGKLEAMKIATFKVLSVSQL